MLSHPLHLLYMMTQLLQTMNHSMTVLLQTRASGTEEGRGVLAFRARHHHLTRAVGEREGRGAGGITANA